MKKIRNVKKYIAMAMVCMLMMMTMAGSGAFAEDTGVSTVTDNVTTSDATDTTTTDTATTDSDVTTETTDSTTTDSSTTTETAGTTDTGTEKVDTSLDSTVAKDTESLNTETAITNEDTEKAVQPDTSESDEIVDMEEESTKEEVSEDAEENTEIVEVTSNELTDAVSGLYSETDLESSEKFSTKTLIVTSDNQDFDNHNAVKIINYDNIYILQFETEESTQSAYDALKNDESVIDVEIDSIVESSAVTEEAATSTNDVKVNSELAEYLYSNQFDNNQVKVAVIDSGINASLQEFEDRIIDSNLNFSSSGSSDSTNDDNGHGTEVASIIAENTYANVKLIPVKVTNTDGKGTLISLYSGIQASIDSGANIINISLSTYNTKESSLITNIINSATDKGIIVIAAAGNESSDVKNYVPANIDSAITVGSVNSDLSFSEFSNYGQFIDYVALGQDIQCIGIDGSGKTVSGTSYSAALITSIYSKMKGINLNYSTDEINNILNNYSIDLGTEGLDNYFGNGLLSYDVIVTENETSNILPGIKMSLDINDVEEWKELSDELLNDYFFYGSDDNNSYFLQSLSEEDLNYLLSKNTYLNSQYNDKLKYYEYLLNMNLEEVDSEAFNNLRGYFYFRVYGGGGETAVKVYAKLDNLSNDAQQNVTWDNPVTVISGNNHTNFNLTNFTTKTQLSENSEYTIILAEGKYTIPARYHVSTAYSDSIAGRMNFNNYSSNQKTIDYSFCEVNTDDFIDMQMYCANLGMTTVGGQTYHQSLIINLEKNTYAQTVYAKFQKADGLYADSTLVDNTIKESGSIYSWSRSEDTTYEGASINSYTVNSNNSNISNPVYIKRKSNVTVNATVDSSASESGWYKGLPNVTFTGSDSNLNIKTVTINSSANNGSSVEKTASEGKNTYSYYATNVNGTSSSTKSITIYADASIPTNLSISGTTAWTNSTVPLTIKGQDTLSGLASLTVQYSINGTNGWTNVGTVSYTGQTTLQSNSTLYADKNGYYKVIATDRVGYTAESSTYHVTNIDNSAPTLSYTIDGDLKNNGWYKGDTKLNLTAYDTGGSGIKSITVNSDEKAGDTRSIDVTNEGSNYYINKATDNAGCETYPTLKVTVKIDKSEPFNLSMTPNTTDWTKDPVQITVNSEDAFSGIDTIELQYTADKDNSDWQEYKVETFDGANVANKVIPVTDNGYYRIIATDNVGYQTTISDILKVDNYDPTDPDASTIGIEPDTIQWVNEPTGVEVTSYGSDELSGLSEVAVQEYDSSSREFQDIKVESYSGETTVEEANYDTHNNNSYRTRIEDQAGNDLKMLKKDALNVDNIDPQAPTLTIDAISTDNGYIRVADGYIIQATIEDSQSGYENAVLQKLVDGIWIDTKIEYQIIDETTTADTNIKAEENDTALLSKEPRERVIVTAAKNIALTAENDSESTTEVREQGDTKVTIQFTVRENGTYRLKGADLVANTAYTNQTVEVNNLDGSMPVIKVEGNPTIWQNTDATLTVLATDADSKIAKMTLDGSIKDIGKNEKGEFYFTFDATKNQEFEVTATDEAGNVTTQTIKVTKIDKEAPILTTDIKKSWLSIVLNHYRNLKVNGIDELSGIKKVSVTYQNKETSLAEYAYDKAKSCFEDNYKIYEKGEYVVTITDHAGNISSQTISEANLDFSAPFLKVEGNPTIWQNTDAAITVIATDENSKISEMTLDGESLSFDKNEKGESFFTFVATKNQEFVATAKDEAGNVTSQTIKVTKIDKEVPILTTEVINRIESSDLKYKGTDTLSGISEITLKLKGNTKKLVSFQYEQEKKAAGDIYEILNEGNYQVVIKDNAGNISEEPITASFEIIDPYPVVPEDPEIPEVPTYPDTPITPTPTPVEPTVSEVEPTKQEAVTEVKAEVEKKATEPVLQQEKEKNHFPLAEILLGIAFFIILLFFILCNVKIYCKTSEGEWKFLGKTRALKYKEIYVVKISKLVRIRKESDSYKLVFSKAFIKTHDECDLIVKIDDIDYQRKLIKDVDTVYVDHK